MGTSSNCNPPSKKKWSFSLPIFRSSSASAGKEARNVGEVARTAEEAVRVRKAAAWQWYTRGGVEEVAPSKTPPVLRSRPRQAACVGDDKRGVDTEGSFLQKPPKPPLAGSPRTASRFKAEADAGNHSRKTPTPSSPSAGPSSPLYDEFELSGLQSHMARFVHRLQQQQTKPNELSTPAAVARRQQSKPLHTITVDGYPNFPAATASVTSDHQLSKVPPSVALTTADDCQSIKRAAPVSSTIPYPVGPISALNKLLRKVVPGPITKGTKKTPVAMMDSSPSVCDPEVLSVKDDTDNIEYHYHHYIHHHHHHYHYNQSPDERAVAVRSWRRHSESSGFRPRIPSLLEEETEEEEDDVEETPIVTSLAGRRRHSESFARQLHQKKANFDEDEEMNGDFAKAASVLRLPGRYNSERFSPHKIPTRMVHKESAQPTAGSEAEFESVLAEIRNRRRHSGANYREEASLEVKGQAGGRIGGRTYKLGGGAGGEMPAETFGELAKARIGSV